VGDHLNRDGYHLEENYGRLSASIAWFKTITGANLDGIETNERLLLVAQKGADALKPKGVDVTAAQLLEYCIDSAEAAIENPYEVTQIK
jgi:hypothetical protein